MSILSILSCLFSCGGKQSVTYTTEDIAALSISCASPERTNNYTFFVYESGGGHLFDAECFTNGGEREISLAAHELDATDHSSLLALIEETDGIARAREQAKRKGGILDIKDADTYGYVLTFDDGTRYISSTRQAELEEFFFDIIDKYSEI